VYVFEGVPLASRGLVAVLNQVFRTLLHSRLQYGLREFQQDPGFHGDVILVEPQEVDTQFFRMNPLAFWERRRAAEYGYLSVTQSIERQFDRIRQILESYGMQLTRRETRERLSQMRRTAAEEGSPSPLLEDVPRRHLA
jgi:hypothetical protein